ncbi:hypothetical protein KSP40_PGU009498 [Platanthera guangdongensis]|uniref:Uncharacterized protein n=1 Tax=Platanthera guangdongensis TaxID=2320717 RepID=A0ABR2MTC2_9ASPA
MKRRIHMRIGNELDHLEPEADHHLHSNPTDLGHGTCKINKRTRGPTTGIVWSKRKFDSTEKIEVHLPADLRRFVGDRSQELITRSGRIVRLYAPLNVERWAHIPVDIIDKIIDIIYVLPQYPLPTHDVLVRWWRICNISGNCGKQQLPPLWKMADAASMHSPAVKEFYLSISDVVSSDVRFQSYS